MGRDGECRIAETVNEIRDNLGSFANHSSLGKDMRKLQTPEHVLVVETPYILVLDWNAFEYGQWNIFELSLWHWDSLNEQIVIYLGIYFSFFPKIAYSLQNNTRNRTRMTHHSYCHVFFQDPDTGLATLQSADLWSYKSLDRLIKKAERVATGFPHALQFFGESHGSDTLEQFVPARTNDLLPYKQVFVKMVVYRSHTE